MTPDESDSATLASATTAPLGSVTEPWRDAVCAKPVPALNAESVKNESNKQMRPSHALRSVDEGFTRARRPLGEQAGIIASEPEGWLKAASLQVLGDAEKVERECLSHANSGQPQAP